MKIVQQILTEVSSVLRYLWKLISAMGYKYKKLVLSHSLDFFLAILNLQYILQFCFFLLLAILKLSKLRRIVRYKLFLTIPKFTSHNYDFISISELTKIKTKAI